MKQEPFYGMTKQQVQKFLKKYPPQYLSPARLISETYFWPEDFEGKLAEQLSAYEKTGALPEGTAYAQENRQWLQVIEKTTEPAAMLELLRKQIPGLASYALRKAVLARESEMLPLLQQRLLRNHHTTFIENAVYCLLRFQTNTADWIVEHYHEFADAYLQSNLCLVVGYRGTPKHLLFLMGEFVRFSSVGKAVQYEDLFENHADDQLEQAPLLAIEDLYERWKDGEFSEA